MHPHLTDRPKAILSSPYLIGPSERATILDNESGFSTCWTGHSQTFERSGTRPKTESLCRKLGVGVEGSGSGTGRTRAPQRSEETRCWTGLQVLPIGGTVSIPYVLSLPSNPTRGVNLA